MKITTSFLSRWLLLTSPLLMSQNPACTVAGERPNLIIMQPDDLPFMDEWNPPPNTPNNPNKVDPFPPSGLPNIERLRNGGVQMMQAYTSSPKCGTSRFSSLTGRLPSRSISAKSESAEEGWDPVWTTIPATKLTSTDCTNDNIAVTFQNNGYQTKMVGKWHLSKIEKEDYSYASSVDIVKGCGFTDVGALYIENMANGENSDFNSFSDGSFSHNMEWVTYEAIRFINETSRADKPFLLYFNPTVPHGSMAVRKALTEFTCQAIADKDFAWSGDPWIKGMSEDGGCAAYRQTVLDRAGSDDENLGKIWLDDSVGAILHALEDNGIFENTIFLFQEDHGVDTKGALYEGGVRIPQFVHYPAVIPAGSKFEGLVSTVDIAPTMMDFAGIEPPYPMDGESWMKALSNPSLQPYWKEEKCQFFEIESDRSFRCGCFKFLNIDIEDLSWSTTHTRGEQRGLANAPGGNLFDLCGGTGAYITDDSNNQEAEVVDNLSVLGLFAETLACHLTKTHPQKTSDFTACTSPFTASPTMSPTTSCSDSTLPVSNYETCEGVLSSGMCSKKKYWSHCRSTCNKCSQCVDSMQKLKLTSKVERVFMKKGVEKKKKRKKIKCLQVKKAINKNDLCKNIDIMIACQKTCMCK